jgi:hypothetical protein
MEAKKVTTWLANEADIERNWSPSTIAMAIYNEMVFAQCVFTRKDMANVLVKNEVPFTGTLLNIAIYGLMDVMGAIVDNGDGTYSTKDKKRRVVVKRFRGDIKYNPYTKIVEGGWALWRVKEIIDDTMPIEEVLA